MAPETPLHVPRTSRSPRSGLIGAAMGLAAGLSAIPALSAPPVEVEDAAAPRLERGDDGPFDPLREAPPGAPLWLALEGTASRHHDALPSFGAMLLLGIPLDRANRVAQKGHVAEAKGPPDLKTLPRSSKGDVPASPPPEPVKVAAAPPSTPPRIPIPIRVTPVIARAAVAAALRQARLVDPDARVDAIVARARASALLPELRLRASRTADEGQSLSPTSYDPLRTTTTGGTSIWLEARATWRLDRLVFADDEVALERTRAQRAEQRQKLVERVLALLFAWQRALALADDSHASPEELLAASLRVLETEAELDLHTGGWFTAWRAGLK